MHRLEKNILHHVKKRREQRKYMEIEIKKILLDDEIWWKYSTIHKCKNNSYKAVIKIYDTNKTRANKKDFRRYVEIMTQHRIN